MGIRSVWFVVFLLGSGGQVFGQWDSVEEATLIPAAAGDYDSAGASVGLDGFTAVIGAPYRFDFNWVFSSVKGLAIEYWPSGAGTAIRGVDAATEREIDIRLGSSYCYPTSWTKPSPSGMAYDLPGQFLYTAYETGLLERKNWNNQPMGSWMTGIPLQALAYDGFSGTLYGSTSDQLVVLVPGPGTTIATIVVGPFGFAEVRGLTFDPLTGTLYGSDSTSDQLLTIDPVTGTATAVGPIGFGDVEGLAFDDFVGVLYGSDTATASLLTIDAGSGVGTAVKQISGPVSQSGSVYVFERTGTTWKEQATLTPSTPTIQDSFGFSASISGDIVVVGAPGPPGTNAPGAVYVFGRTGSQWTQLAVLQASDRASGDLFGYSTVVENDTILVGAPFDDHSGGVDIGSVYVFERQGTSWLETAKLTASSASDGDAFGVAIDVSGPRALVGAPFTTVGVSKYVGVGYTFVRSGSSWTQEARLAREPFFPYYRGDDLGLTVALSGDTAILGAPYSEAPAPDFFPSEVGAAWVFERTAGGWTKQTRIQPPKPFEYQYYFAHSVAADGDRLLAGSLATFDASGGKVHLITPNGPKGKPWKKTMAMAAALGSYRDYRGWSVALSGDTVLAGAPGDDHAGGISAGSATVFRIKPPTTMSYCQPGTSANGCAATITTSGTPSASAASGFVLTADNIEGQRPGLFLYGNRGAQGNPWGNGSSLQCIVPPLRTGGVMPGVGTLGTCDGTFTQDLNALWCPTCPMAGFNPGDGHVVQAQLWYRDPVSTSNQTTSFSNAIEFWVEP